MNTPRGWTAWPKTGNCAAECCMFILAILFIGCGHASGPAITVEHVWVRPNIPPVKIAAAYMTLRNAAAAPAALIGASTDIAATTEIHVMSTDGNIMKMQKIDRLPIPAQGTATLQPGGNHLMLINLKRDLNPGDTVTLTLTFDNGQKETIHAPVKAITAQTTGD